MRGSLIFGGLPLSAIPGKIWLMGNFQEQRSSYPPERLIYIREDDYVSGTLKCNYNTVLFEGYGNMFGDLIGASKILLEELKNIATRNVLEQFYAHQDLPIVINVRRGRDFRTPKVQADLRGGAVLTPIGWFVKALSFVRQEIGADAPALVVSEGKCSELKQLLQEPNTILARTSFALTDLLLLSRAKYLIGTGGSSFSAWGGFLSQADVFTVEGQSLEWFSLDQASAGHIRTISIS